MFVPRVYLNLQSKCDNVKENVLFRFLLTQRRNEVNINYAFDIVLYFAICTVFHKMDL
jgi:hypothetical protein